MRWWYQIESHRRGSELVHFGAQEFIGPLRLLQLDYVFSRPMRIRGDAFVSGIIPVIDRLYLENGDRSVANHPDRDVAFDSFVVPLPVYRRVRYAFGDAAKIHRPLLPRIDRDVWHVTEGRRELDCQVTVLVSDAADVFGHALVKTIVLGEGVVDRQDADRLAGHVVRLVRHDEPVVLRLSAHHVLPVGRELPEDHLGRWPAEGLAHDLRIVVLHHGLVHELHNLGLDDYVHLNVGGGYAGGVCRDALVLARVLAVHVGDGEHTRDRIDPKAIGDGEILLSEGLDPCEHWRRLADSFALDVCILAFDDLYWARDLFDRWSCVHLYKNY